MIVGPEMVALAICSLSSQCWPADPPRSLSCLCLARVPGADSLLDFISTRSYCTRPGITLPCASTQVYWTVFPGPSWALPASLEATRPGLSLPRSPGRNLVGLGAEIQVVAGRVFGQAVLWKALLHPRAQVSFHMLLRDLRIPGQPSLV